MGIRELCSAEARANFMAETAETVSVESYAGDAMRVLVANVIGQMQRCAQSYMRLGEEAEQSQILQWADELERALAVTATPAGQGCGCNPMFCRDLSTCRRNAARATPTERTPQRGGDALTPAMLADALGCFWNAAVGSDPVRHDSTAAAAVSGVAQGFAAIEQRLREFALSASAARSGGDALSRDELFAALVELTGRIEACGASVELTRASSLACDLAGAIGNQWNSPRDYALTNVRAALQPNTTGEG